MRNQRHFYHYASPIGPITLCANAEALIELHFGTVAVDGAAFGPCIIANAAHTQLLEYLAGKRRYFDIPLLAEGSGFQQRAWEATGAIPYAECLCCADLAKMMGQPTAHRQVGMALKANPLPIFIPDHRVTGSHGRHLGDARDADRRSKLLQFEQGQVRANLRK